MAEADWERLTTNALDELLVSAGATTTGSPPDGTKCMGYHLIQAGAGFSGHICALANFSPIPNNKGGVITACMRKFNNGDHSPVLFFANDKDVATAQAYILGLSGENPTKIILKKGSLNTPLVIDSEETLGVSDADYPTNPWVQLALHVTVNTHGDVAVVARIISPIDVTPPIGTGIEVPGIAAQVDDIGAILTGSDPYGGTFYVGHGVYFGGSQGRKAMFDYTIIERQTSP